ncbi:hypothetical protein [Castellaniella sp. UC4442_H9]
MQQIKPIVEAEIDLVTNPDARRALHESYEQAGSAIAGIEGFFDRFTSHAWSPQARYTFFRNWRTPGIGAASFCALTFRMMAAAEHAKSDQQSTLLYRCATRISEVSHEDVGIGTTDHQQLYENFATRLAGSDEWKLDCYRLPGAKAFLTASRKYRQNGEDLGRAMLISLPEELYNHGEFSYAAPRFARWHRQVLARPESSFKDDLRFIHDHLGNTERGHFAALVKGFEDYCVANSIDADWQAMFHANTGLLNDMAENYRVLFDRLVSLDEPYKSAQLASA